MQDAVRPRRSSSSGWLTLLTVMLAAAGIAMIWVSQHTHRWAAPPVPQTALGAEAVDPDAGQWFIPHNVRMPSPPPPPGGVTSTGWLDRSVPVTVRIPSIGVNARIIPLGLDASGSAAVPPLSSPMLASWYDREAAPGQPGPTVLAGHVDAAVTGPAVFYQLGNLHPGDLVYITRHDHRTAVFRIGYVGLYPEWDFPRYQVYGYSSRPVLRIVTCGGRFDDKHHLYLDRTVAFGTYLGQR
jgi:hypothetical protein